MFAAHARRFSHKAKVVIPLSVEKMQALQHSCDTGRLSLGGRLLIRGCAARRSTCSVLLRRLLFILEERRPELVGERRLLLRVVRLALRQDGLPGGPQIAEN